jgi:hypothetical protein
MAIEIHYSIETGFSTGLRTEVMDTWRFRAATGSKTRLIILDAMVVPKMNMLVYCVFHIPLKERQFVPLQRQEQLARLNDVSQVEDTF